LKGWWNQRNSSHKIQIGKFIKDNKHIWSIEAVNYFVSYINYWKKSWISVRG
jgi:excinuclease UvrABC helicase subunit UvrB